MEKTYRVAVIGRTGRGNYGHALDEAWLAIPQVTLVGVADDNMAGLAAAAKRLKVKQTFRDWRKLLEETNPDIVAICPRWIDQHAQMALAAAQRGIHIFIEKPFCRTLAEADRIADACHKTHTKLVIAHPTRYSPTVQTVKKLIQDGAIGRVLEYRGRGKEDSRRGGGEDLWVLGTHIMDLIRTLAGHPQWCFATVTQNGRPITKADVVDGNEGIGPLAGDAVHATYGFAEGCLARFDSVRGTAGRPSRYGLQIYGSRGIFEILEGTLPSVKYLNDPSWSPGRSGKEWQNVSSAGIGKPEPLKNPKYQARHTLAIRDLIHAIEDNKEPAGGLDAATGATEMIVACFESQRLGRPVSLPLSNRENPLQLLEE